MTNGPTLKFNEDGESLRQEDVRKYITELALEAIAGCEQSGYTIAVDVIEEERKSVSVYSDATGLNSLGDEVPVQVAEFVFDRDGVIEEAYLRPDHNTYTTLRVEDGVLTIFFSEEEYLYPINYHRHFYYWAKGQEHHLTERALINQRHGLYVESVVSGYRFNGEGADAGFDLAETGFTDDTVLPDQDASILFPDGRSVGLDELVRASLALHTKTEPSQTIQHMQDMPGFPKLNYGKRADLPSVYYEDIFDGCAYPLAEAENTWLAFVTFFYQRGWEKYSADRVLNVRSLDVEAGTGADGSGYLTGTIVMDGEVYQITVTQKELNDGDRVDMTLTTEDLMRKALELYWDAHYSWQSQSTTPLDN